MAVRLTTVFWVQTGRFMFPLNRPCPSTPQSLTPKLMQLRFGANSPRPSPFYSPSSVPVPPFRCVWSQQCLICVSETFVSMYQVYLRLLCITYEYIKLSTDWPLINSTQSLTGWLQFIFKIKLGVINKFGFSRLYTRNAASVSDGLNMNQLRNYECMLQFIPLVVL